MNLTKRLFICAVAFSITVIGNSALAAPGAVALTIADLSCGDASSSDIYIDCMNGTVTDNRTGLIWLKNVGCLTMGTGGAWAAKLTWDRATISNSSSRPSRYLSASKLKAKSITSLL